MKEEKADEKGLSVKKSENFSEWYVQVLTKSGMIDYTDVSGCIVFRPAAYALWEEISRAIDTEFKKDGVSNVYFPLLIPEKLLQKEQAHLEGFTPEVAWVTQTGDTVLEERLAVRPTSETIMYASYAKWVRSWRDLPLRYNQWNNVLRWEFKHPTPFIRSREFLWNEGHSVFATSDEAIAERGRILGIYKKILEDYLAIPGIVGRKSEKEKFAGAVESYSIEHMMPDGWAIQGPDHHFDGQNFSKAFEIKFLDKNNNTEYGWQTTYAITTREIGVLVATHGDDKGIIMPPRIAHVQVVIVPIFRKEGTEAVKKFSGEIAEMLKRDYRVRLDDRDGYSPGFKFNEWELKGVPIRVEIGPKEVEAKKVVIVRRDTGEKHEVGIDSLAKEIGSTLGAIHSELFKRADAMLRSYVHNVKSYDEFKKLLAEKKGIMHAPWCGEISCEEKIKEETGAKITNIPVDQKDLSGKCVYCGKDAKEMANFARSY